MFVNTEQLKSEGWTLVTARAIAAAGMFASKETSRPILNALRVSTHKGFATVEATDSYRAVRIVSRKLYDNPEQMLLPHWGELKASKIITTKPIAAYWLGFKLADDGRHVEVQLLDDRCTGGNLKTVANTMVRNMEGNYPTLGMLYERANEYEKRDEQSNLGPYLNGGYVVDVFQALNLAVSYDGPAPIRFVHGDWKEAILFEAQGLKGHESACALLMPLRGDGKRNVARHMKEAA